MHISTGPPFQVQCCFTSTETVPTIRDGEPRTATSTFTQLLTSVVLISVLLHLHRDRTIRTIRDGGAQDGHLDFHTQLLSSERPYSERRLIWPDQLVVVLTGAR